MPELISGSPAETGALGEKLGALLQAGDLIALRGDLGAGKTCLAQGIARGLGVKEPVVSPTFTLINEYQGRLPLYHFDVYRLAGPAEMDDLGYDEYFYGSGVTLVEWANLVQPVLPREYLEIALIAGEQADRRVVRFNPVGEHYRQLAEELIKSVCVGH